MSVIITIKPKSPIVILDANDGHGAALEYRPHNGAFWANVSYHGGLAEAVAAFWALPFHKDREPAHYRIRCHPHDAD